MKTHQVLILFLAISFSSPAWAQDTIPPLQPEKILLKLNLKPQNSYRFISHTVQYTGQEILGSMMESKLETRAHYQFEVMQNLGNEIKIKATFERIEVQLDRPQDTLSMDTDLDQQAPQSLHKLAALTKKPFYIFLDQQGKIVKWEGLLEEKTQDNDEAIFNLQESLNSHYFIAEIEKAFHFFPEDSVSMGETWRYHHTENLTHQVALTLEKSFTMEGLSEDLAWINVNHKISNEGTSTSIGDVQLNGSQKGNIEVDRISGLILFSECTQELTGAIQTSETTVPLKITSTSTVQGEII